MIYVDCLCAYIFVSSFIGGGNGGFYGVNGDVVVEVVVVVVVVEVVVVVVVAVVLLVVVDLEIMVLISILLWTSVLIVLFDFVQYLPIGGYFSEGRVALECAGICACGSWCSY